MKKAFLFFISIAFTTLSFAQQEIPSGSKIEFGAGVHALESISVSTLEKELTSNAVYSGVITGKVVEVCLKKGCFMKVEREGSAEPIMVRFKDYGFFVPSDIVGKTVLLDGEAKVKETTVEQLKHFAEDAGKSAEEISKINSAKSDIEIIAVGVRIVN